MSLGVFISIQNIAWSILLTHFSYFVSICFYEEFFPAFSMVIFAAVLNPVVKLGLLFTLGVSESFKRVWGVMGEPGAALLFGVAKYELLLNPSMPGGNKNVTHT